MKEVKTLPIGTEVYYFNPTLQDEIVIKKSLVLGAFIHKQEGELYYFLLSDQQPAYAVAETLEELDAKKSAFVAYRETLVAANAENKVRFADLRKSYLYEDYTVDTLPLGEEDVGSTDSEHAE